MRRSLLRAQHGFSLVELVVVIVVLGVLAGSMAVMINNPVRGYFEAQRRVALSDAADTALRRIGRDLQGAVPNSVRIASSGSTVWIEFTPAADSGRYRSEIAATSEPSGTDPLDFNNPADTSFQVLGAPVTVPSNAQLVIFNLGAGSFDLYAGSNRRSVTTPAGSSATVSFTTAGSWPAPSPDSRFYLVTTPVSYACTPSASGAGTIERYSGYAFSATQPTSPPAGATRRLLIDRVVGCSFELNAVLANGNGVAMTLVLGDAAESVRLFSQVYLPNTP